MVVTLRSVRLWPENQVVREEHPVLADRKASIGLRVSPLWSLAAPIQFQLAPFRLRNSLCYAINIEKKQRDDTQNQGDT